MSLQSTQLLWLRLGGWNLGDENYKLTSQLILNIGSGIPSVIKVEVTLLTLNFRDMFEKMGLTTEEWGRH
jgi:hypothetical protein